MIEKYLKLHAPKEDIRKEILAFATWPEWWPGLQQLKVVSHENGRSVVDVVFKDPMTISMTLGISFEHENLITFSQIKGWFKSYRGEWAFLPSPDGQGTTLRITLHIECGVFVPKSMVHRKLSHGLTQLGDALNSRLPGKPGGVSETTVSQTPTDRELTPDRHPTDKSRAGQKPVHIFYTKSGFEIWVSGKRYVMKSLS